MVVTTEHPDRLRLDTQLVEAEIHVFTLLQRQAGMALSWSSPKFEI